MPSIIDKSKIIKEFGQYYINEGQNKQRLVRALVQPAVTLEKNAKHIKTAETKWRMANYQFGSLIQPFSNHFNPNSNIEFIPNQIDLHEMKTDIAITPHEIEESYLGFLAGDSTRNMKDWPIVRWLMEEYIAKQISADREQRMVYKGIYNPNGTNPEDCMDGIKQILINGAANQDYPINVIPIGQLTPNTIFDQVEMFDEAINELYTDQKVIIFMSPYWARQFKKDKRSQGFYVLKNEEDWASMQVDFTNHYICPLPSMSGTNDIWATVPENLIWLTKREGALSNAEIQAHDYDLHIMISWWEGLGFACNQMVWASSEAVNQNVVNNPPVQQMAVTNLILGEAFNIGQTDAIISGYAIGNVDYNTHTITIDIEQVGGTTTTVNAQWNGDGNFSAFLNNLSSGKDYEVKATFNFNNTEQDTIESATKTFTTL